jgi:hypothetical protein
MDDSDLAGPILFFLLFGFCLLFVRILFHRTRTRLTYVVWEPSFWFHLWPCGIWKLRTLGVILSHGSTYHIRRLGCTTRSSIVKSLLNPYLRPLYISFGLLHYPASFHLNTWHSCTNGLVLWLHSNQFSHCLVHIQLKRYVLCCGTDE